MSPNYDDFGDFDLDAPAGVQSIYGQGSATIVGLIPDPTKAAVAGAHVTLINEGTGIRATALSDSGGRYNSPQRAAGNYRVEVTSEGFMSLFKTARIAEGARVEFRWEFFNALNHPNPGNPNLTLSSANLCSTTAPRIMQVGTKILF
jgi:hypothetical protein